MSDNINSTKKSSPEEFLQLFSTDAHIFYIGKDDNDLPDLKKKQLGGTLELYHPALTELNAEGNSIFFCVNESDEHERRKKSNIIRARAIWIDDDVKRDKPRTDFPIPPNIVVESSPGKYHYYWLTSTEDLDTWDRVMDTMVSEHGCDKNSRDRSRVLRLPGFYHNKRDPHLVTYEVLRETPYPWSEILAAFPPSRKTSASKTTTGKPKTIPELKQDYDNGHRHGPSRSAAMKLANEGYDVEPIVALLLVQFPDVNEAHHRQSAQSAVDKVNAETVGTSESNTAMVQPWDALINMAVNSEDVQHIKDAVQVVENLGVSGSVTVLCAPSETGKTALARYITAKVSKNGHHVLYFDLDSPPDVIRDMLRLSQKEEWTYLAPDIKQSQSAKDITEKLHQILESGKDLTSKVFIFDTLKKFANMINKDSLKEMLDLTRKLASKGATLFLLSHTNKYHDPEGNLIPEGTGDLRSDVDTLIIMESADDAQRKVKVVSTIVSSSENPYAKNRFGLEPVSFDIIKSPVLANRVVVMHDQYLDVRKETSKAKAAMEQAAAIDMLTEAIAQGHETQEEIVKVAHEIPVGNLVKGPGIIKLRRVLKAYSRGELPDRDRIFNRTKGEKNSYRFSMNSRYMKARVQVESDD